MAQSYNYPAAIITAPLNGLDVNLFDAAGNPIGSTGGALDVNATLTDNTAGPTGVPVPAEAGYIAGKGQDGNLYGVNLDNSGNLFALPLPTGAATAALQTTANTLLGTIITDLISGAQITQITGTVPLPTGAATEATLAAISAKFGSLGQKTMAGSAPVVIASDQTAISVTGTELNVLLTRFQDISAANINGSAGAFVALGVGGALGSTIKRIQVSYTAGEPLEFGVGATAGAAVRKFIINQGDGPVTLSVALLSTDLLWVKSLSTTAVTAGYITMNLMG